MAEKALLTVDVVKKLIAQTIGDDKDVDSWDADTDIINTIGLDSLQIVQFLIVLEDYLDKELDFEELDYEWFSSIGRLVEVLNENYV